MRVESILALLAMLSIGAVVMMGTEVSQRRQQQSSEGSCGQEGMACLSVGLFVHYIHDNTKSVGKNEYEGILATGTPAVTALDKPPTSIAFTQSGHPVQ